MRIACSAQLLLKKTFLFFDFSRIRKERACRKSEQNIESLFQQHATGVGSAAYPQGRDEAARQLQLIAMEPQAVQNRDDLFVWPWMGVLGNVPTERKAYKHRRPGMFGCVVTAADQQYPGPIWDYLHKNGDLKTIADVENEEARKTNKLVANLASQIEVKRRHVEELECKYNETTTSLDMIMEQKDQLLWAYNEGLC